MPPRPPQLTPEQMKELADLMGVGTVANMTPGDVPSRKVMLQSGMEPEGKMPPAPPGEPMGPPKPPVDPSADTKTVAPGSQSRPLVDMKSLMNQSEADQAASEQIGLKRSVGPIGL
jgi:hypothetical protein